MTGPEPKSAHLIATEPTTVLPWEQVRAVLADTRLYWLATVHPTGRPHARPVLAVWVGTADEYALPHDALPFSVPTTPSVLTVISPP